MYLESGTVVNCNVQFLEECAISIARCHFLLDLCYLKPCPDEPTRFGVFLKSHSWAMVCFQHQGIEPANKDNIQMHWIPLTQKNLSLTLYFSVPMWVQSLYAFKKKSRNITAISFGALDLVIVVGISTKTAVQFPD